MRKKEQQNAVLHSRADLCEETVRKMSGGKVRGRMARGRRTFAAVLLVLLMTLTMSGSGVYADILDDIKTGENALVAVEADNEDCLMLESLKDLSVSISSEEADINIEIPVKEVETEDGIAYMWLGIPTERIEDAVMRKLAEIQGDIALLEPDEGLNEAVDEVEDLLTGFQVEIHGLPEGHYTMSGVALVYTAEVYREAVDTLAQAIRGEGIEFDSFSELIEKLLAEAGLTLDDVLDTSDMTEEDWEELGYLGITEETFAQMKELILNIDAVIEYFCSDEFSGFLICNLYLECDCPYIWDYQIQHRYYERIDGKLKLAGVVHEGEYEEGWEEYCLYGEEGTVISGIDYQKPVYQGKTYTYEGCYDDYVIYDDFRWKDNKKDTFVLGDMENYTSGLVLRYIRDEERGSGAGTGAGGSQSASGSQTANPGSGSGEQNGQTDGGAAHEGRPATGDSSHLEVYLIILAASVIAISAMTAYQKRK